MRNKATRTRRALVLLSGFGWIAVAKSETLNFGVDAGVGETDNVTLVHDDRISQTIAVTDVDFDYAEKSRRLDVDAIGKFSYLDYLQNAYHSELIGRFDGNANFALIPQRLTWEIQDDFGQAAIDPFTPATPTNLENVNYVSTGPDMHLKVSGTSFIDASARVAETHFESSPFSNIRVIGSLAWGANISARSSVSLNVASERVLFDNTLLNPDFDISNVFVKYEIGGGRTILSFELGDTVVSENGKSSGGTLAKINLSRKLSQSARISLNLGRDSTDASASFAGIQPGATGTVGAASAPAISGTYSRIYGAAAWEYQRNRTTLGLSGRWEKDDYANEPVFNHRMTTCEIRLERRLREAVTILITGRLFKTDYENANVPAASGSAENQTNSFGAALNWHHGRGLELKLALEHTGYTTSAYDGGYRENRLYLTVGYRPTGTPSIDGRNLAR